MPDGTIYSAIWNDKERVELAEDTEQMKGAVSSVG